MTSYERETIEFQAVTVTVDGVAVTDGVTFCIAPQSERPALFTAPATLAGNIGVMIQDLQPGGYRIWARVESNPEQPVINCGYISIT
jgi:hypothetical protein